MASIQDSYLSGSNIEFIEGLYARYLDDPASVDPSWREIFDKQSGDGQPIFLNGNGVGRRQAAVAAISDRAAASAQSMDLQSRVDHTIYAFRLRGHLVAKLDPLGRPRPRLDHVADYPLVNAQHFSPTELERAVDPGGVYEERQVRLKDLVARLRRTYCDHVGVEFMRVSDSNRRRWLLKRMEQSENRAILSREERRQILTKLSYAVGFENFLHTKYVGVKRFSLEGAESLVPMIDALLEEAGDLGVHEVVIGMAHRGRLNVLANVLGKSFDQIFSEFEGPADPSSFLNRGDVKYHLGFSADHVTGKGHRIHLSLAFNPSHLEAVDPVVEGRVRAKQDRIEDLDRTRGLPLLIHGDASFPGQGVVEETLNFADLSGYSTGGTIHVIINNQVGFTTDPRDEYSALYCSAPAQLLEIPIFHVNGDDPEACVHAIRLAMEYRQRFHNSVVLDVVCFRRYGHNEGDEPSFTQPKMYELIRAHPTVRQLYGEQLVKSGEASQEEIDGIQQRCLTDFNEAHARAKKEKQIREPSYLEGLWKNVQGGPDSSVPQVDTGVDAKRLSDILTKLTAVPSGFTPHPKLQRLFEARREMAAGKRPLDWAAAEALALATLALEGYRVRMTGQDTERGTFSQRHAVLHDYKTGEIYEPFQNLSEVQASCTIINSPLSEMGCLGFEFGYSLDYPDALVVWEAQYGDFNNNAQVIIDQFIAAAEDKWRRLSGVTLLLPHGYEGSGPEHSSARLERFLQLSAEDNIQVCYPTTPGQLFHLLRRQVIRPWRKPLIVMSPKSMLRRPEVVSSLEELSTGRFQRLLWGKSADPSQIRRLLLCSGKIYYDLLAALNSAERWIEIARLEQLYPFPSEELKSLLERLPNVSEVFWVQEEPKNMGAWRYMLPLLQELIASHARPVRLQFVGRVESASPATGFYEAHVMEQKQIVEESLSRGESHGR